MAGYGDNAGFTTYAIEQGATLPAGATADQITAARQRGAMVVDRAEPRFTGTRTGGYAQERAWPREGAITAWGETIASSVIPEPIIRAGYEAALIELVSPGSLSPVVIGNAIAKREKAGSLEVEYAAAGTPADLIAAAIPVVTTIDGLIRPFLNPPQPAVMVV